MTIRTLCLAGALTVGLGSAAMAQSVGVYTPLGGIGIEGPATYSYGYDRYDDGLWRGAYAYSPGVGVDVYAAGPVVMYPPSNLHWRNPNANPNLRRGYSIPAKDNYRSQLGINSY